MGWEKDWAARLNCEGTAHSGQELPLGGLGILAGSKTRRDWFPPLYNSLIFSARHLRSSSCSSSPDAAAYQLCDRQRYHVILILSVLPSPQSTLTYMYVSQPADTTDSPRTHLGDLQRDFDPRSSLTAHQREPTHLSRPSTSNCFSRFCLTRKEGQVLTHLDQIPA